MGHRYSRLSERLPTYFWQEPLTERTWVAVRCPCSVSFFLTPLSFAMSLASSFILCIFSFETTPLTSTLWLTWLARSTELLPWISHVLPSCAVKRYSLPPV